MIHWRGFTLWEALCALAVAGITIASGAPALRGLVLDARRTADVNAFVAAVQLARSEAAKRGRPVVLCKTVDALHCGGGEIDFGSGWIVFVDEHGERARARATDDTLLLAHRPRMSGTVSANRQLFEFRPHPLRSTNGTVTFCDARGAAAARAVVVSYTGRPRVSATTANGGVLTCPELGA